MLLLLRQSRGRRVQSRFLGALCNCETRLNCIVYPPPPADRMLDMGFSDDVKKVVDAIPSLSAFARGESVEKTVQTLLFSATLPDWVKVCVLVRRISQCLSV